MSRPVPASTANGAEREGDPGVNRFEARGAEAPTRETRGKADSVEIFIALWFIKDRKKKKTQTLKRLIVGD